MEASPSIHAFVYKANTTLKTLRQAHYRVRHRAFSLHLLFWYKQRSLYS